MAAEENNQENDFIEPEENFLNNEQFPVSDEGEVFRKKGPLGRRMARKRKTKDFPGPEESAGEGLDTSRMDEVVSLNAENSEPMSGDTVTEVKSIKFPGLEKSLTGAGILTSDMFTHIPVQVKVVLGSTEVSLKEVLELSENSIITLDKLIGESLDLVINEQVIAQGEVVVVDGNYGLKITKIVGKN